MSRWTFRDRGRWKLGPLFVNFVRSAPWALPRITSWGLRIFGWTRNVTRGTDTIDTPGRGSIRRRYR